MARRSHRTFLRRLLDYGATIAFLLFLAASAVWFGQHSLEIISAPARVVDGDSLEMSGRKIRLVGIDAPELDQQCVKDDVEYACGLRAKAYLQRLIGDLDVVECRGEGEDKYGRILAECFAGEESLNAKMVNDGWAVSYGEFYGQEREARNAGRGVWAGEFAKPQQWRIRTGGLAEGESRAILTRIWRQLRDWYTNGSVESDT